MPPPLSPPSPPPTPPPPSPSPPPTSPPPKASLILTPELDAENDDGVARFAIEVTSTGREEVRSASAFAGKIESAIGGLGETEASAITVRTKEVMEIEIAVAVDATDPEAVEEAKREVYEEVYDTACNLPNGEPNPMLVTCVVDVSVSLEPATTAGRRTSEGAPTRAVVAVTVQRTWASLEAAAESGQTPEELVEELELPEGSEVVSATLTLLTADVTGGDPQATGGGQDFVDGAGGESFVSDMQGALALDMPADYVEINVDPPSPPPGAPPSPPSPPPPSPPEPSPPPPTLPPPPPPTPEDLGEALIGLDEAAGLTEDVDPGPDAGLVVGLIILGLFLLLLAAGVGYYFYNKQKRASKTPFTAIVPPPASSPAAAAEQPKADLPVPPAVERARAAASSDQGRPGMTWLASQEAADATSLA